MLRLHQVATPCVDLDETAYYEAWNLASWVAAEGRDVAEPISYNLIPVAILT